MPVADVYDNDPPGPLPYAIPLGMAVVTDGCAPMADAPDTDRLIRANLRLVYRHAHRYAKLRLLTFDDLVSEGMYALVRAARGYDPATGNAFSSYAVPAIARAMCNALRVKKRDRRRYVQERRPAAPGYQPPAATGVPRLDARPAPETPHPLDRLPFDPAEYLSVLDELQLVVVRWRLGLSGGRRVPWPVLAKRVNHSVAAAKRVYAAALEAMRAAARADGHLP